ncbi:conjugative transposon protein TraM [Hymenobacter persicinus]|uniref:Conjugative transposon protein TraM n=1 Tax=Hymenobacter persicinus TaxID=2025506 RepID=A0A4Q5LGF7_9BACT|nr:conjugative transposon protein TraM [Hymenobacter persicinus]RYU84859.1 conjugative transposon protein TraM [Hymenobacter persicinus]
MEPIIPPTQPVAPVARPENEQSAPATAPVKRTPTEVLRSNWMAFAGLLLVLIIGGLFLWLKSAKEAAQQEREPVAAASANIEPEIPSVETAPPAPAASPSAQIEAQRRAEQDAQSAPARATDQDVVDVFAVDTTGLALRKRRRAQAAGQAAARRAEAARLAAADVDTIETTIQDPATGSYRAQTLVVPRRRLTAGGGGSRRAGTGRSGRGLVPARDVDGTPFETDPDVLAMLGSSPPETRAAYERMTGKRYRDPNQTAQLLANRVNAPGMDGFNTVKVGNATRMMAQGSQREQQLAPDVFFKCVINGEQKVRTGSVVILRLLEDAVVSGVTFPKNMVFAGVATVGTNNVTLEVNRLGPTRVQADIYDFNYMPGIMIDPVKRVAREAGMAGNELQQQTTQEISTAIDRSASAAKSVVGVGGRVAASVLSRPKTRTKLRDVLLPDGYPILITTAAAGQLGPEAANR